MRKKGAEWIPHPYCKFVGVMSFLSWFSPHLLKYLAQMRVPHRHTALLRRDMKYVFTLHWWTRGWIVEKRSYRPYSSLGPDLLHRRHRVRHLMPWKWRVNGFIFRNLQVWVTFLSMATMCLTQKSPTHFALTSKPRELYFRKFHLSV